MPPDAERQKTDLIKKVIAESRKRLGKNAQKRFAGFLSTYFAQVPPQDILGKAPKMLFGLAHGHWKQGRVRARWKPLVRVFNPDPRKNGWHDLPWMIRREIEYGNACCCSLASRWPGTPRFTRRLQVPSWTWRT